MARCTKGKCYFMIKHLECWKCKKQMKVVWAVDILENGQYENVYKPPMFDKSLIELAAKQGVNIVKIYSNTRKEAQEACLCPHCGAFYGNHFIDGLLYDEDEKIPLWDYDKDELLNNALKFYDEVAEKEITDKNLFIDEFMDYLPVNGHVLELGCGNGSATAQFLQNGYRVYAVDGSSAMCKVTKRNTKNYDNIKVVCKKFEDFSTKSKFDGIWADAAFLHCPIEITVSLIESIQDYLVEDGCFYISVLEGEERIKEIKGVCYFQTTEKEFEKVFMLENRIKLSIIDIRRTRNMMHIFMIKKH